MLRPAPSTAGGGRRWPRVPGGALLAALAGIALVGCSAPVSRSTPSPTASSAPVASLAGNRAASLRTRLDVAFDAHVMLLARAADAAAGGRAGELHGWEAMVHEQGVALAATLQDAAGSSDVAARARQLLGGFDGDVMAYVAAGARQDAGGQAAAASALSATYVPGMTQLLAPITGVAGDQLSALLTAQVRTATAMVDARLAAGDWNAVFASADAACRAASALGDALAAGIAHGRRGRYPGDPSGAASTLQAQLATRLQEQVYLMGFAASAAVGGRTAELAAARGALAAGQADVGTAMAPIGNAAVAKTTAAIGGLASAVVDDAVAVSERDAAARQVAEARITAGFPDAMLPPLRKAGLGGDAALSLVRAVAQALRELAQDEGAARYSIAPSAARDAAQATTALAKGVAGAMVKTYAGG